MTTLYFREGDRLLTTSSPFDSMVSDGGDLFVRRMGENFYRKMIEGDRESGEKFMDLVCKYPWADIVIIKGKYMRFYGASEVLDEVVLVFVQ